MVLAVFILSFPLDLDLYQPLYPTFVQSMHTPLALATSSNQNIVESDSPWTTVKRQVPQMNKSLSNHVLCALFPNLDFALAWVSGVEILTFSVAVRRSSCSGDGEGVACSSMDLQKSATAKTGWRKIKASYGTNDTKVRAQRVGPEHCLCSRADR